MTVAEELLEPTVAFGLAERFARQGALRPRDPAFCFLRREDRPGEELDWGALWSAAVATAHQVRAAAPAGARVAIACEDRRDFVIGLCACLIGGVIAVPVPVSLARRSMPRAAAIVRAAGIAVVLVTRDSQVAEWMRALDAGPWPVVAVSRSADGGATPQAAPFGFSAPQDVALIQFTSGTTGQPSGIALSHANLAANCAAIAAAYGLSRATRGFSWLPLNHDMGLVGHVLTPIWLGCASTLLDPLHFLQRPLAWLRLAAAQRATITSAPNFAFKSCLAADAAEPLTGIDLGSLTAVVCGGEPVQQTTVERFLARFAALGLDRGAFAPSYGLAEATLLVASGRTAQGPLFAPTATGALADLGPAVSGMTVRILRDDGTSATEGESGEIAIAGTSVGRRLHPDGSLAPAGELRTGDLGFLKAGRLHVAGRIKELIILRGENVHPAAVEAALLDLSPMIVPGGVAALGVDRSGTQELVLLVELERKSRPGPQERDALRRAVMEAVARAAGHVPGDVHFMPFGMLPRTPSGKVRRAEAAALYLQRRDNAAIDGGP